MASTTAPPSISDGLDEPLIRHHSPIRFTHTRKGISIGDEDERGATSMSSVFTLCNSAIGAGVLSLPFAFRRAGWVGCLLMCLILGSLEAFTLYVLSKFAERYQATSYGKLIRKALGRKLGACLSTIMLMYLWGSCIAYLVIIGDSFRPLLELAVGTEGGLSWMADRRLIIVVLGLLVVLPMCFPRDLSALEWISMAAVCGFLYTALAILIRGTQIVADRVPHFSNVKAFQLNRALFALPIVVFGFNCHANVVTIFSELKQYPEVLIRNMPEEPHQYAALPVSLAPRPRTHKLIGMLSVILSAIALIMGGYLAVGFAGYLAFPLTVGGNVLNVFPLDDVVMQVARGIIGAVVVGHYPLNHHPARLCMQDLEHFLFSWDYLSVSFSVAQTTIFVVSTLCVAVVVTDLGSVLHMVGGTAAAFMIFFLPGLLLINAAIVKESAEGAGSSASVTQTVETGDVPPVLPVVASPHELGIKRRGFIYSPRKSWWTGVFFVALAVAIFTITIVTAIVPSD